MYFIRRAGNLYVDRGDPDVHDVEEDSLTLNGEWQSLNLINFIPKGTKLVFMSITIQTTVKNKWFFIRKKGNVYDINVDKIACLNDGQTTSRIMQVVPDVNGAIEYKGSVATWTFVYITIIGWFMP